MFIRKFKSLGFRFLAVNFVVAVVPMIVLLVYTVPRMQSANSDSLSETLKTKAVLAAHGIDSFLEQRVVEAKLISQADVLETTDLTARIQYLTEIVEATPWIDDIDIIGIDGIIICSSGDQNEKGIAAIDVLPGINYALQEAYNGKQGDVFVSEAISIDSGTGLCFITPITDDKNVEVVSLLSIEVSLSAIEPFLKYFHQQLDAHGAQNVSLVNNDGRVIIGVGVEAAIFEKFPDLSVNPYLLQDFETQGATGSDIYTDIDGVEVVAGYADLGEFGVNQALDWSIIATVSLAEWSKGVTRTANQTVWFGLIIALMAVGIGAFLSRSVVKRISLLGKATAAVGSGDLTSVVSLRGNDELSELSQTFNQMVTRLRDYDTERVEYLDKIASGKDYTENIIASLIDMLIVVSNDGTIVSTNDATCNLLGYDDKELIGCPITILFNKDDEDDEDDEKEDDEKETSKIVLSKARLPVKSKVRRAIEKNGSARDVESFIRTRNGDEIPVVMSISIMQAEDRSIKGIVFVVHDASVSKRAEEELRESHEMLTSQKNALDHHAIVSITDIRGDITFVNDKFCEISGYSRQELIGQNHRMVKSDEHDHKFYRDLWKSIATGKVWKGEIKNRSKDGSFYWVNATIVPFKNNQGKVIQYVAIRNDITQRKEQEQAVRDINESMIDALHREKSTSAELEQTMEQLEQLATTDKLTGLPNRRVLLHRLEQELKQSKRNGSRFAVLFFDFDRFKAVNDSLGHDVGDELLCEIAGIFRDNLRDTDMAARIGGDEFVVMLTSLSQWSDANIKANELLKILANPHTLQGHRVVSTASIGLVTNERAYESASEMIRDADAAMYQAKDAGKGQVVEFDQAMHQQAIDRLSLEEDLNAAFSIISKSILCGIDFSTFDDELYTALGGNQFHLAYQPIVNLETGELSGFEALMRWNHPERGSISPLEFIPIAEETGLIIDIGKWVLDTAAKQLADWNKRLCIDHRLSINVNLSKRELLNSSVVDTVVECISKYDLRPEELKVEVTETTIVDDRSEVIPVLVKLRDHGILIAMDDFGTGLSSLSALHEYPIDVLKIDQSFVKVLDSDRSLLAVVASITTLSQNLGIKTVAEGIESAEVVAALQSIGCTWGQGYYFAKPMSHVNAEDYILKHFHIKPCAA